MKEHPHQFVKYEYVNIRQKNYPWGENTLFWNPAVNGEGAGHHH